MLLPTSPWLPPTLQEALGLLEGGSSWPGGNSLGTDREWISPWIFSWFLFIIMVKRNKMVVSLQEWAKCVKWTIKPFRALGPRTWLIGTPEKPPHSLHFNGSPILASLMPGRSQHVQSPLVAGPKPNNNSKTPSQPVAQALNSDPWAMWTGPRLQSHPTAVAPRAVSGPVETQLNQQSELMDKLEAALGTLQQSQAKQSEDIKRTEAQVKKSDSDIRQHLDNRLTEVRRELDQSFTAAIQQQSKTFDSNLQDIKRLLLQPKRKSDHSDMEDWSLSAPRGALFVIDIFVAFILRKSFSVLPGVDFVWTWFVSSLLFITFPWAWVNFLSNKWGSWHLMISFAHKPLLGHYPCYHCIFDANLCQFAFCDLNRPLLGAGIRFGEAQNPGPDSAGLEIRCAITNPTCLSKKFETYSKLLREFNLQIISMSETAATDKLQVSINSVSSYHLSGRANSCSVLDFILQAPFRRISSGF